jgi:HD-GYP domain-containing protein (c-di-GMP phosphodiesterase class II)
VYDALRTNRPYREAWESERVLQHLEQGAGPDFDLESATAFVAMMRSWERRVAVMDETTELTVGADAVVVAAPAGTSAAASAAASAVAPAGAGA